MSHFDIEFLLIVTYSKGITIITATRCILLKFTCEQFRLKGTAKIHIIVIISCPLGVFDRISVIYCDILLFKTFVNHWCDQLYNSFLQILIDLMIYGY